MKLDATILVVEVGPLPREYVVQIVILGFVPESDEGIMLVNRNYDPATAIWAGGKIKEIARLFTEWGVSLVVQNADALPGMVDWLQGHRAVARKAKRPEQVPAHQACGPNEFSMSGQTGEQTPAEKVAEQLGVVDEVVEPQERKAEDGPPVVAPGEPVLTEHQQKAIEDLEEAVAAKRGQEDWQPVFEQVEVEVELPPLTPMFFDGPREPGTWPDGVRVHGRVERVTLECGHTRVSQGWRGDPGVTYCCDACHELTKVKSVEPTDDPVCGWRTPEEEKAEAICAKYLADLATVHTAAKIRIECEEQGVPMDTIIPSQQISVMKWLDWNGMGAKGHSEPGEREPGKKAMAKLFRSGDVVAPKDAGMWVRPQPLPPEVVDSLAEAAEKFPSGMPGFTMSEETRKTLMDFAEGGKAIQETEEATAEMRVVREALAAEAFEAGKPHTWFGTLKGQVESLVDLAFLKHQVDREPGVGMPVVYRVRDLGQPDEWWEYPGLILKHHGEGVIDVVFFNGDGEDDPAQMLIARRVDPNGTERNWLWPCSGG